MDAIVQMDWNCLLWIQDYIRNDFLTPFVISITRLGDSGIIWILITLLLLIRKKTRKVGMISAAALLGALFVDNLILKRLIARIRPYEVIPGLKNLIEVQKDFSFPSGHAGSSFSAAVVCFLSLPKKYGIPAIILAALIALSRLYVGVHYPTDVLAGMLIGTLIGLAFCRGIQMVGKGRRRKFEKIK